MDLFPDEQLAAVGKVHYPLSEVDPTPSKIPKSVYVRYEIVDILIDSNSNLEPPLCPLGPSVVPVNCLQKIQPEANSLIDGAGIQEGHAKAVAGG
ncbi:MAG: hypothetical protein ABI831_15070 [Betaproteobacteria bacterium]